MNKILIFLLLFAANFGTAQNKFVGDWKVTEVDANSYYYYNVASDSISISEELRQAAPKPNDLEFLIRLTKSEFNDKHYVFSESELVEKSNGVTLLSSKYHIDESQKLIQKEDDAKMPKAFYEFVTEDKLLLAIPFEGKTLKLTLKRLK